MIRKIIFNLWLLFFCVFQIQADELDKELYSELILFVMWGEEEKNISYRDRSKDDPRVIFEVPVAVNSFWVTNDESIYLLEGGKTLKKYKEGEFVNSIYVGNFGYVHDFSVIGDHIVLITQHEIFTISLAGKEIERKRIYGFVEKNSGVEKIIVINEKIVLTLDPYIKEEKRHLSSLYSCLGVHDLKKQSCIQFKSIFELGQLLDSDGKVYVWNDVESRTLKITDLNDTKTYSTDIDVVKLSESIDFLYNSIVRVKGEYIYLLKPNKKGLSIIKYKWNQ